MFKVGDKVRFIADTYHSKHWPGEFIVTQVNENTTQIKREWERFNLGGYYHHRLELAIPIDKQAAIIAKIKYLNTRFNTRKQHATLG